jgi:hypothetical protein
VRNDAIAAATAATNGEAVGTKPVVEEIDVNVQCLAVLGAAVRVMVPHHAAEFFTADARVVTDRLQESVLRWR